MLRHIVLLRFVDGTPPERIEEIAAALRGLPALIPELRGYQVGTDLGIAEGNADIAVVAELDDLAGYETYRDHPSHLAVIDDQIRPCLATRIAVQHIC